jgi:hypothetical protein
VGARRVAYGVWCGDLRKRNHLEDLDIDGRIILKSVFKKWDGGMDWNYLAQGRDRWRALVNAIFNLQIP